uniref:Uncharacterized protein n=1 Tax=Anguilla anguilla TaxID=7936 RepID=A0A0E9URE9_ANGAN
MTKKRTIVVPKKKLPRDLLPDKCLP